MAPKTPKATASATASTPASPTSPATPAAPAADTPAKRARSRSRAPGSSSSSSSGTRIHVLYALVFLTLEPLLALGGAVLAAAYPAVYLSLTRPIARAGLASASQAGAAQRVLLSSVGAATALRQLANLYLLFALTEAVVLRAAAGLIPLPASATHSAPALLKALVPGAKPGVRLSATGLHVWRGLLACLLVADVGHLLSLTPLGLGVYWRVWEWNAMDLGNVGVVYAGAALRIAFLAGVGVGGSATGAAAAAKAKVKSASGSVRGRKKEA